MIKLTIIELKKLFHKKSIYVIMFLMLIFCLLNNILYYLDYNEEGFYKIKPHDNIKKEIKELENNLSKYNINEPSNTSMYLSIKTKIDILKIKKSFEQDTWQYHLINNYLYDLTYQKNMYIYQLKEEIPTNLEQEYQEKLTKIKNNDWEYFINLDIKKEEATKKELENTLKNTKDTLKKEELEQLIKENNNNLKILKIRKENKIKQEHTYLNVALEELEENTKILENLKKKTSLTNEEQLKKDNAISKIKVNEYILKTKQNINKENTLNYELRTISEDYELFIVILILMISSTIICEEFTSGTIKLLLIKPYSRGKILLSKYLACFLVLVISIIFLIIIQLGIGSYLFGIDSLKIPVIIYHFGKHQLIKYSIWTYMLIRIISRVPFFILLITISFTLSIFFTSTVVSITIPMLIYMFDQLIRNITLQYNLKITKYLLNINWHFENYLFGKKEEIPNINLKFSSIICISYFICLAILTLYHFKRKNIRNI